MVKLREDGKLSGQDLKSMMDETGVQKWGPLYRYVGIAVIAMLVLIPVQVAVFTIWPTPKGVPEWFSLFQSSRILGLLHLDLLYIINNTIVAVMYLALYMSLRKKNEALMLIALLIGLLGIAAYYSSNPAFEMMSLSRQYAGSSADAEKTMLLVAGQTLINRWKGTAFDTYYILSAVSLILMTGVMFKSRIYGRATAAIGLSSGILMLIPSSAGSLGLVFSLASLLPWIIFSALSASRFFRLYRLGRMGNEQPGN